MDGFEVVAALKQNPAWHQIPIVVLTSKDLTEDDRQRLNGRVQRILAKGAVDREQLLAEIQRVLQARLPGQSPKREGRSRWPRSC